ncbi:MAG: Dabb family protein [Actinomycetota bacterium]
MFHHVVLMRFKDGTSQRQIDAIADGLASLPEQIDVLIRYRFGSDVGITDGAWDFAATAEFAEASHYSEYSDHPAHQAVLRERIAPVLSEVARTQFET